MRRIGLYLLWLLVIVESIFIATWIINDYVHREKPPQRNPIDILNPEIVRESIVKIEYDSETIGYGSGFFIAPNKIATNIHVIAQPGTVSVKTIHQEKEVMLTKLENGNLVGRYENRFTDWTVEGVLAYDVKNDVAILKVSGEGTPLSIANTNSKNEFPF